AKKASQHGAAHRRSRGPRAALPSPAFGRPRAAGGHRARHRQRPNDRRRRRADGRPGPQKRRGCSQPPRKAQHATRQDHLDGDARPNGGRTRKDHSPPGQGKARVMTLTSLALRNLARNKFRVTLTVVGVGIAIMAFLLLRTVIWAWASGAEWA